MSFPVNVHFNHASLFYVKNICFLVHDFKQVCKKLPPPTNLTLFFIM